MNKNLYEQAKTNVLKERDLELKEDIKKEQERLIYESKKVKVTNELAREIVALEKKIWSFPCRRMWEDRYLGRKCAQLRDMIETGMYHPKELEELKQFAIERKESEKKRKK